mmetsp:Transcript_8347/g.28627  ORF Transcript_8347/g.28627 Transcript_8347/m.28627 type:complete len:218 (+) Transcript_8347:1212-1865(+)
MRTPWWSSYLSWMPRSIDTVWSTVGSGTATFWSRRSKAGSFSTCFMYSASVVAPMHFRSPRASAGFRRFAASMAPFVCPAPINMWISSMNRIWFLSRSSSVMTALSRASKAPRADAPAISRPRSSAQTREFRRPSGTSPSRIRAARPSTMAVFPTPGGPTSTGLFFLRRDSTWTQRRISSSRPTTGSILPSSAFATRSTANCVSASKVSWTSSLLAS